jgi:hypothetical protein
VVIHCLGLFFNKISQGKKTDNKKVKFFPRDGARDQLTTREDVEYHPKATELID